MKHQARKRFGQNFLQDAQLIERIVQCVAPQAGQALVEIGPGLGAITLPLLEQTNALEVVEIDRDLIAKLERRKLEGLTIHSTDALSINWSEFAKGRQLRIVGNLPYNIGTPLLIKLLESHQHIQDIHVMLQKEVVDRLIATVGNRSYGRLSVLMQSCFDIDALMSVPPEAFDPAPKVQSAVVKLTPRKDALDVQRTTALSQVTRIAFANKRKTLRNNFKNKLTEQQLEANGINPQARAETLDLAQFLVLSNLLSL